MRTVKWNQLASEDYFNNIDYLLTKWSHKEAQHFIDSIDEIVRLLQQGNIDFQETDYPMVKRCVLQEQITLSYKIVDEHFKI